MPTITEARSAEREAGSARERASKGRPRSRALPVGGLIAALAVWFVGMALGPLALPPTTVVAFGPPEPLLAAAAEAGATFVAATPRSVTLRSGHAGTVRHLYRRGAWLVLPSLENGCLATGEGGGMPSRRP